MDKKTQSLLIFGNQFLNLENIGTKCKILSGMKHECQLVNVLSFPLITLDGEKKIYAKSVNYKIKEKFNNKIVLNQQISSKIDINLESSPYFQDKSKIWFKFLLKMRFFDETQFTKAIPEIVFDILPIHSHIVDPVSINQPTLHTPPTDEWKSNDMPASFLWNPETQVATILFINFSTMNWMSSELIERFSNYMCGYKRNQTFGLLQRVPLEKPLIFPPNTEINFEFYIRHILLEKKPSKWEAVESLIAECFDLLPAKVDFPENDLNWRKYSKGCINDLMKENLCWENPKSPLYHAYVMENSEYQRRKAFGRKKAFETMTLLDILPPWIQYLKLFPNQIQKSHVLKTCTSIKSFIDNETNYLYNNVHLDDNGQPVLSKPSEMSIGDSWYFFEPIARFGWLIRLLQEEGREELVKELLIVFISMAGFTQQFVYHHKYAITAFYDPFTFKPFMSIEDEDNERWQFQVLNRDEVDLKWKKIAKNYACIALYLYIMIQAYYFTNNQEFLEEAKKSSVYLMKNSPDELFWEPLELAYGVSGLTELYKITGDVKYLHDAKLVIYDELRMFYWYEDNTLQWKGKRCIIGFPMACIGIRYPAMKENLESVYPWTVFLKYAIKSGEYDLISMGLLKFFNLIRINSFYYFSNILPADIIYPPRRETECPFIPFEDLEMLETPPHFSSSQEPSKKGSRTGILGRECYGAGEVIWLCLLFEGVAQVTNREILIINLDFFDFTSVVEPTNDNFNFLIFNPTKTSIKTQIVIHPEIRRPFLYKIRSLKATHEVTIPKMLSLGKDHINIELENLSVYSFEIIYKERARE